MGLDDFFDQGHKRHHYGNDHDYRQHDDHKQPYDHHDEHQPVIGYTDKDRPTYGYNQHNDIQKQILEKLKNNPGLKKMLIVGAIIVLVIILLLVILLFPVILKLLGFVTENGVQGVLDTIWKGTK
ncbi:MAG: hypothetical protein WCK78_06560 [Paludibacter sp.]